MLKISRRKLFFNDALCSLLIKRRLQIKFNEGGCGDDGLAGMKFSSCPLGVFTWLAGRGDLSSLLGQD